MPADRHPTLSRYAAAAWLVLCAAAGSIASAQDSDAWSIEQLMQKKAQWLLLKETTLKVEGRYQLMNDQRVSFTNSELLFEFAEGVRSTASRSKTVQVTGALETRKGKLTFVITRIKEIPSDADRLADRRGRLPRDDAAPWYVLADWAAGRGRFYKDDELLAGAAELRTAALQIEYRQTGIADIEPLYALARKAETLGLPPELRDEIVHDALRRELRGARQRDVRHREVVLSRLFSRLPGADVPVTRDDAVIALLREYEQAPLDVYQRADADRRRTLNRLLYSSAALERIELDAADDGRNGYQIAERIEQTVPEFSELANQYRQRQIDGELQRLPALSRDELLTLSERLEQRGAPAQATESRRAWLAAQAPAFRERGSSGLLDLAKEHISLLDDPDAAARIYMELYATSTGQQTAGAELVKLGYQYDGTNWVKATEAVVDPTADAIRRGIVRSGMTSEQVRAALGKPTSVVKFAVRGQVSELWVYQDHGVAIELRRRGGGESIAMEVSALAGPGAP